MNSLIESQSEVAKLMPLGHVNSNQGESPRASEMAMYVEMGIAVAVAFGFCAIAAWAWYLANPDWVSSIRRLQEMI